MKIFYIHRRARRDNERVNRVQTLSKVEIVSTLRAFERVHEHFWCERKTRKTCSRLAALQRVGGRRRAHRGGERAV